MVVFVPLIFLKLFLISVSWKYSSRSSDTDLNQSLQWLRSETYCNTLVIMLYRNLFHHFRISDVCLLFCYHKLCYNSILLNRSLYNGDFFSESDSQEYDCCIRDWVCLFILRCGIAGSKGICILCLVVFPKCCPKRLYFIIFLPIMCKIPKCL